MSFVNDDFSPLAERDVPHSARGPLITTNPREFCGISAAFRILAVALHRCLHAARETEGEG
jgi:hypothetical protein